MSKKLASAQNQTQSKLPWLVRPGKAIARIELMPIIGYIAKLPILCLGIALTFAYLSLLFNALLYSGCLYLPEIGIAILATIFMAEPKFVQKKIGLSEITPQAQTKKQLKRLSKEPILLYLETSPPFRKTIIALTYPGLYMFPAAIVGSALVLLLYFALAQLRLEVISEHVCACAAAFAYMMPILLTRKQLRTEYALNYWLTPSGIFAGFNDREGRLYSWDQIKSVELEKEKDLNEIEYDEDNPQHNQFSLYTRDENQIAIPVKRLNSARGKKFVQIITEHLAESLIASSACRTMKEWFLPPSKIAENETEFRSFTQLWEADLKSHIGRTNYVPLKPGDKLQSETLEGLRGIVWVNLPDLPSRLVA